jgi:phosphoribosyl 1,2-cyclic phosphodiesterase
VLRFCSLGSGSSGNATLVESHESSGQVTRLLIDCGFTLKELDARLQRVGVEPQSINGIFITHEHGDHIGCGPSLALREGVPIYMSQGTYTAIGAPDLGALYQVAQDHCAIELQGLCLQPFTVPHDAREPLQLVCTDGQQRLGIVTDLGHVSAHVSQSLMNCAALLLECNHDEELLAKSKYPPFLRQRVGGDYGHLTNSQAAALLQAVAHNGLKHVLAAHLSEQNNRPELAQRQLAAVLNCALEDVAVAHATTGSPWFTL